MIDFSESVRLARLHERIRHATFHAIRRDGHHKSSEGHISLAFNLPPVVGDSRDPYWSLEIFSYVLIDDGRTKMFTGQSAAEVIAKAEDAADQWCMAAEFAEFDAWASGDDDAQGMSAGTAGTPQVAQGEARQPGADRHAPDHS